MPEAKSRSRFPSTSVTQTPSPEAATTGADLVDRIRYCSSPAMIARALGPGIGTRI